MSDEPGSDHETTDTIWCAGLPHVRNAPLEPREAKALRARVRSLGWWWAMVALGTPLALTLLGALGVSIRPRDPLLASWEFGAVVFGSVVLGLPVALLLARDLASRRRKAERDLEAGEAELFEGVPIHRRDINDEWMALHAFHLLDADRAGPQQLRVLPASECVLARDARGRDRFLRVRLQRAARPPEYAWRVEVHRDLVPLPGAEGIRFKQRGLTEAELVEIRGYVRSLQRPHAGLWFGLALLALALLGTAGALLARDRATVSWREWPEAFAMLLVGGLSLFAYLERLRLSQRLRLDLDAARAVTVEGPVDAGAGRESAGQAPRAVADGDEFLPVSGAAWTVAGRPAEWRDSISAFDADAA